MTSNLSTQVLPLNSCRGRISYPYTVWYQSSAHYIGLNSWLVYCKEAVSTWNCRTRLGPLGYFKISTEQRPQGKPRPCQWNHSGPAFWSWWPVCLWQVTDRLWNYKEDIFTIHMDADWLELNGRERTSCLKKQMYADLPPLQRWPRLK